MIEVMTTKKPKKQKAAYPLPVKLIDQLLVQVENKDAESILGENGLAGQLKKMLAEHMLSAELSHHLAVTGCAVPEVLVASHDALALTRSRLRDHPDNDVNEAMAAFCERLAGVSSSPSNLARC